MSTTATFPLLEDPPAPEEGAGGGASALAPLTDRAGLGYGLITPFRRDQRSDFQTAGGATLVKSAVQQVVGTRADDGRMTGELPWRPEFGSLLHTLQFMNIDEVFAAIARSRVASAVARWEPRARVNDVSVVRTIDSEGRVRASIRVFYDIVQQSSDNVLVQNQQLDVPLQA